VSEGTPEKPSAAARDAARRAAGAGSDAEDATARKPASGTGRTARPGAGSAAPASDGRPGDTVPDSSGSGPGVAADGGTAVGPELARAVLDAALARRRAAQQAPRRRTGNDEGTGRRLRGYSGPGPDPRDPQLFGVMLERIMKQRGWQKPAAEAKVFGAWEKVVGPDVAQHSRPVKLDAGVLTVEAESTAWATQLRLLAANLLKRIAAEVGHNVVTKLNIHGPAAPSWAKGPRRVQGRGPRDTYG
jgi:predicted nucleic acid-binding Zn ribbon protein